MGRSVSWDTSWDLSLIAVVLCPAKLALMWTKQFFSYAAINSGESGVWA